MSSFDAGGGAKARRRHYPLQFTVLAVPLSLLLVSLGDFRKLSTRLLPPLQTFRLGAVELFFRALPCHPSAARVIASTVARSEASTIARAAESSPLVRHCCLSVSPSSLLVTSGDRSNFAPCRCRSSLSPSALVRRSDSPLEIYRLWSWDEINRFNPSAVLRFNLWMGGFLSTGLVFMGYGTSSAINGIGFVNQNRLRTFWVLVLFCFNPPSCGLSSSVTGVSFDENESSSHPDVSNHPVSIEYSNSLQHPLLPKDLVAFYPHPGDLLCHEKSIVHDIGEMKLEGSFLVWRCGEPPPLLFVAISIGPVPTSFWTVSVNPTVSQVWQYATVYNRELPFRKKLLHHISSKLERVSPPPFSKRGVFHPVSKTDVLTSHVYMTTTMLPSFEELDVRFGSLLDWIVSGNFNFVHDATPNFFKFMSLSVLLLKGLVFELAYRLAHWIVSHNVSTYVIV